MMKRIAGIYGNKLFANLLFNSFQQGFKQDINTKYTLNVNKYRFNKHIIG